MKRPGKPEGPHYLAHQAVDSDYGIIVGQSGSATWSAVPARNAGRR
ncbi:hypothetical protein JQM63_08045 [Oscillibacter valericigenes]|nr:hypothetical protein [Oscillibacter valericigenes]